MRVLVVSDVHANLVALEAVLAESGAVDAVWNLGDTVGYGPRPGECLGRMTALGPAVVLAGNHDLAAVGEADLEDFNPVARAAAVWTSGQLTPEHRTYLAGLPSTALRDGVSLAHASPRSPVWEYVSSAAVATANFAFFATDLCLVGHTHVAASASMRPGERRATLSPLADGQVLDLRGARLIVNPGSVGQPRDRDPRAAYAVLDTEAMTITAHRVAYDIAATQRQMTRAGLPDPLVARLALGR